MTNLQRYDNNGLELVIDTQTGESFASIRAMARMVERGVMTISDYVKRTFEGVRGTGLKTAQVQTRGGTQTARLLNEPQMLEVVAKYKPELMKRFVSCGLRMYLHGLAGYKYQAVEEKPRNKHPQTYAEALMEAAEQAKRLEVQTKQLTRLEILEREIAAEKEKLALQAKVEEYKPKAKVKASDTALKFNAPIKPQQGTQLNLFDS